MPADDIERLRAAEKRALALPPGIGRSIQLTHVRRALAAALAAPPGPAAPGAGEAGWRWIRESNRALLAVMCCGAVLAVAVGIAEHLLRPWAASDAPGSLGRLVLAAVLVGGTALLVGLSIAPRARVGEVLLLGAAAGVIVFIGIEVLAEASNAASPPETQDENPLQTGVALLMGLLPGVVLVLLGWGLRCAGAAVARRCRPAR